MERTVGAIKKGVSVSLSAICVVLVLYLLARVVAVWKQGYSWAEMDWNQDGSTSLGEFFSASDISKRTTKIDDQLCVEYFSLKDGLPIKKRCPP
jgi:hypothetical protein